MLSVIIPARNEKYLQPTIDSILSAAEEDIEVIAILDGYKPDPPIKDDPRVTLIHNEISFGQRRSVNQGATLAKGKYILKTDAHSMFDQGFDRKLKADCEYDWTVIPRMYVLDHEAWKPKRNGTDFMYIRSPDIKDRPLRAFYLNDGQTKRDFPVAYKAYKEAPWTKGEICDVMTGNGACFFMHKDRFWELGGMDEDHGSWGQMGVEVALKAWLSGGYLKVNKKTWFAHMFHTKGNMFPYPMSGREQQRARDYSIDFWTNEKWKGQKKTLAWLVDKFSPVPSWNGEGKSDITVVYLTMNKMPDKWKAFHKEHLLKATKGLPIITVSKEAVDIGKNLIDTEESCYWNIYRQILRAAKEANTKYIAVAEDDVLYHADHFTKFRPKDDEVAYNRNRWSIFSWGDPIYSLRQRVSNCSLIAPRALLIEALQERFDKYPNNDAPEGFIGEVGRARVEKGLGVTRRKSVEFYTNTSIVQLSHELGTEGRQKRHRKVHAEIRSSDIPYWGKAEELIGIYEGNTEPSIENTKHMGLIKRKIRRTFGSRVSNDFPPFCGQDDKTRLHLLDIWAELGYTKGVEVGVYRGEYSEEMLKRIPNLQITLIDPWAEYDMSKLTIKHQERNYTKAKERLAPWVKKGQATIVRESSESEVANFKDNSLDFVYIDGSHHFNHCAVDLIKWSPKVRSGGMVAVHDYNAAKRNGVLQAVNGYTYCNMIKEWYVTKEIIPTAFWVKE